MPTAHSPTGGTPSSAAVLAAMSAAPRSGADIGTAQRAGCAGLLLEPLDTLGLAGDLGVNDLEGDVATHAGIADAPNLAHPVGAQRGEDRAGTAGSAGGPHQFPPALRARRQPAPRTAENTTPSRLTDKGPGPMGRVRPGWTGRLRRLGATSPQSGQSATAIALGRPPHRSSIPTAGRMTNPNGSGGETSLATSSSESRSGGRSAAGAISRLGAWGPGRPARRPGVTYAARPAPPFSACPAATAGLCSPAGGGAPDPLAAAGRPCPMHVAGSLPLPPPGPRRHSTA
jgi:hypothetical protein